MSDHKDERTRKEKGRDLASAIIGGVTIGMHTVMLGEEIGEEIKIEVDLIISWKQKLEIAQFIIQEWEQGVAPGDADYRKIEHHEG